MGAFYLACLSFLPAGCFEDAEALGALQQSVGEYCGVHSIFSVVSKDMVSFSDVIKPLLGGCNPWFNVCHLSLEDHSRKDHDSKVMGPLAFLFACKNGPEEGGGHIGQFLYSKEKASNLITH